MDSICLIFFKFFGISFDYVEQGLVHPDPFHPPPLLLLIVQSHFDEVTKILILPIKNILQGIIHFFIYDWSALYNQRSVDAAVDRLLQMLPQCKP
jgi:hypothetical protein